MNKTVLGISALGAVAVTLGLILSTSYFMESQPVYRPGHVPPATPLLSNLPGETVADISQAVSIAGLDANLPTYLPKDYQVRLIKADKNLEAIIVLASKVPITSETTDIGYVWNDAGLRITFMKPEPGFDEEKYISTLVSDLSYTPITVNGMKGAAQDIIMAEQDGETINVPAEIVFYKGDVQVFMIGFQPVNELQKIAESLG